MKNPKSIIAYYLYKQEEGALVADSPLECLVLFYKWLIAGQCVIRDDDANQVPLFPNTAQLIFLAKLMNQAAQGKPMRIVILKARKVGMSTIIQALYFFMCAHYKNRLALTLAHETKATEEIFDIPKLIAESYVIPCDAKAKQVTFPANRSKYYCRTAGGQGVGAGGTPNYLHLSEMPKWRVNVELTDVTATNSVPFKASTIICYESTAQGRELFWKKFEDAADPLDPYVQMFVPWYLDERCKVSMDSEEVEAFELTEEEALLITNARSDWGVLLELEALQWRRIKIRNIGPEYFRQEFPSTPEEAVQATKGLILPGIRGCTIDRLPFSLSLVPNSERVGGIDYGYYDATVIISAIYHDQTFYVYEVYRQSERLADEHAKYLREGHTYWIDPTAPAGREEMLKAVRELHKIPDYCRIIPAAMTRVQGQVVKPQLRMWKNLIAQGRFKVLASCVSQLTIEADSLIWNPKTGEPDDSRSEMTGHYDVIAAGRYMIASVLGKERQPIKKVTNQTDLSRNRATALRAY